MKDSELVYGLMASFDKKAYSFAHLKHLTEPFGVSETSLRTCLSRMAAKNTVHTRKQGRNAYYSFSSKGRRIGRNVAQSFSIPDWTAWDKSFWGVLFSVPESHGAKRYDIRKKLAHYRFAGMYSGFWIRPARDSERIPEALEKETAQGYCRLIRYTDHQGLNAEEANALWNLDTVNHEFLRVLSVIDIAMRDLKSFTPAQALVSKMTVGNEAVDALCLDPLLPPLYLPSHWAANTLRERFMRFDRETTQRAEAYWENIFDAE